MCRSVTYHSSGHWWFSGRILACHAGGPGSIPGQCIFFFSLSFLFFIFIFSPLVFLFFLSVFPYNFSNIIQCKIAEYNFMYALRLTVWPMHDWVPGLFYHILNSFHKRREPGMAGPVKRAEVTSGKKAGVFRGQRSSRRRSATRSERVYKENRT